MVLLTGVMVEDPGVSGSEVPSPMVNGVDGDRIVLPPHLRHFAFSPAGPEGSPARLLRRTLRLGW